MAKKMTAAVVWRGPEEMRGLLVPIADLRKDDRNARLHDERSYDAIRKSYDSFGQRKPIVAGGGVVVAGNGSLEAARRLGWTHLAVVGTDGLSPEQVRAFALADNRTAELSDWDFGALKAELDLLPPTIASIDLGWTPA